MKQIIHFGDEDIVYTIHHINAIKINKHLLENSFFGYFTIVGIPDINDPDNKDIDNPIYFNFSNDFKRNDIYNIKRNIEDGISSFYFNVRDHASCKKIEKDNENNYIIYKNGNIKYHSFKIIISNEVLEDFIKIEPIINKTEKTTENEVE